MAARIPTETKDKILELLRQSELSQSQIAAKTGVSRGSVQMIQRKTGICRTPLKPPGRSERQQTTAEHCSGRPVRIVNRMDQGRGDCSECGAKNVRLPCHACFVRRHAAGTSRFSDD